MTYLSLIGFAAGICTTLAFIPQVVKTWQSKSAKDLSLGMYLILCLGLSLWMIYGFLISDVPVILANSVTLMLGITILYFKLRFKD